MYVCQTITFESLDVGSSYLHTRYIEFVYEGHRVKVKVKVTGTKMVENSYSRNVKLRSAITPVLYPTYSLDLCMQYGVFGYGGSNGVIAILVT